MMSYRITFITPLFSTGSYKDRPEVRPPSLRGQLRWWFRALGGTFADEKEIFGGMVHKDERGRKKEEAKASAVIVRVSDVPPLSTIASMNTLPHKNWHDAHKACFPPGTHFDLHITTRLRTLSPDHQVALKRTVETWLMLGTLGLRATRGAGSFISQSINSTALLPSASDANEYSSACERLLNGAPLRFTLIRKSFTTAEEARKIVSDTLGGTGNDRKGEKDDLTQLRHPLGKIVGKRKTSPLRFRIVKCCEHYHIAAIWDNREVVTGNLPGDLQGLITLLCKEENGRKMKEIGGLLRDNPF